MRSLGAWFILIGMSLTTATAGSKAVVRVRPHQPWTERSCRMSIVGVDGRALPSAKQQIALSPGLHCFKFLISNSHVPISDSTDLEIFLQPGHHYSLSSYFPPMKYLKVRVDITDDTQPSAKPYFDACHRANSNSSNHTMQPTALRRYVFDLESN